MTTRIVVVGGGITGISAAIAALDASEAAGTEVDVEVWEADDRLGGKIATSPFASLPAVDEGPDAFLARLPWAAELARRVGIGEQLVSPTDARASVWYDGLHGLPGDIVLGVPSGIGGFATSNLLSWRGKLRAAVEPLLPRGDDADSIGRLVRGRFGDEVHDRLVDALVGSIYAADTDRWSLAAMPQLGGLARRHRSLLLAGRAARAAAPPSDAPIFATPVGGLATLVDAATRHATDRGVTIRTSRAARSVARADDGWSVDDAYADAVVLATPAAVTARLLDGVLADTSALRAIDTADVLLVRLATRPSATARRRIEGRSGYLVPKSRQRLVTAASFASQKWAHWRPDDGTEIMRVSLGRDGLPVDRLTDDDAVDAACRELRDHLGVGSTELAVDDAAVSRWIGGFPQYRPGHLDRLDRLERSLPPGIHLAGASYHGIGIPTCVASGTRAGTAAVTDR